jgi:hypothetical protein
VLIQIVIVVDDVPVSRAVGMNVGDLVSVGLRMGLTVSKAVVIAARSFGGSVCRGNERRLERERNHRRHHGGSRQASGQ